MNFNDMKTAQWRAPSCIDVGQDESIIEIKNCNSEKHYVPELLDETKDFKDTTANNTLYMSCLSADNEDSTLIEEELLDAMNNLRIISSKKAIKFQPPLRSIQDSLDIIKTELEFDDEPNDVKTIRQSQKNECEITVEGKELEITQKEARNTIKNSQKLLVTKAIRKTTIAVSPLLLTKLRAEVHNNMSTLAMTSSGAGFKPPADKKAGSKISVKTISNTEEGLKLKEQKINYFSIPVVPSRKKRTQAMPFSFESRSKLSQSSREPSEKPTSIISAKQLNVRQTCHALSKLSPKSTTISPKSKSAMKPHQNNPTMDQENKAPNISSTTVEVQQIKARRSGIVPPKSYAAIKVSKRQEFDAKVKQRSLEIAQMRAQIKQKKQEKEKDEFKPSKRTMDSKLKAIPPFKVPVRVSVKKPPTTSEA